MSVSRVFNGQPGVGHETARRIEVVAQAMGFRPNRVAANLRRRQQLGLIGMIVPEPYTPLFTEIKIEIDEQLRAKDLIVVTANSGRDVDQERALITSFIDRGIDGVILISSEDSSHHYLARHLDQGFPVVLIGSPPRSVDAPAVLTDNRGGTRQAVAHLAAHGHHRIGVISNTTSFPASERLAGYHQAVAEHGLDTDPALVCTRPLGPEHGREAAETLMDGSDAPTAIVSTNYLLTTGVLTTDHPKRNTTALIGFDDFEAASLVDPPVTIVAQDSTTMGREAARLLLDQIAGRHEPAAHIVVATRLIARGSGELPPKGT